jgi:hypothetical protein
VWASVTTGDVGTRVRAGSRALGAELRAAPADLVARRREPAVWSALEYGGHVRDVLLHLRDRLVVGIVEDTPSFKPLYRDQRVDAGLYREDRPDVVAAELEVAADLFARTFALLDADQLARPVRYAYPTEQVRTVLWMGQQTVHEVEHHLADTTAALDARRD